MFDAAEETEVALCSFLKMWLENNCFETFSVQLRNFLFLVNSDITKEVESKSEFNNEYFYSMSEFVFFVNIEHVCQLFKHFHPSVAFHLETSHLIWIANQMTDFYLNTGRKWVNKCSNPCSNWKIRTAERPTWIFFYYLNFWRWAGIYVQGEM